MSVYLGDSGCISIRRQGEPIATELATGDVDVAKKRFSVDYGINELNPFITGDLVEIRRVGGGDLELVSGHTGTDGNWYVNVDAGGGMRLYETFQAAVNGGAQAALELVTPTADQDILIDVVNLYYRNLASIKEYEITTTRETVDTTILGEEFRSNFDQGLISGQGSINCIWHYESASCDRRTEESLTPELPHYLAQLVIRYREGARFKGHFYINKPEKESDRIWYEADCIVTSVSFNFEPTQIIFCRAQFVTTGPIALRAGVDPEGLLLQEVLESNDAYLLERQEEGLARVLIEEEF